MGIKGTKHTDSDASAMKELAAGNRQVKASQRMAGEGFGNGKSLMGVSDSQDKISGGLSIRSDKRGNPK